MVLSCQQKAGGRLLSVRQGFTVADEMPSIQFRIYVFGEKHRSFPITQVQGVDEVGWFCKENQPGL